jgi:two-component system chemotaxis response regulator CheB
MSAPHPIRVLVVDDSPLVRRSLEAILERDPGIVVVGSAIDGMEALAKIRALRPDVVTLDVLMPRLDGIKVLACAMGENPLPVLMLSSLTQEGAEVTLQALDLGAVDFVDKNGLLSAPDARAAEELLGKLRAAAAVEPSRLGKRRTVSGATAAGRRAGGPAGADLIVIGASTGGPAALQALLPALPADLPAGLVVIQHIPAAFTRPLAARLDAASSLTVREAEAGDRVRPGEVLIAPGGRHLTFALQEGAPSVQLSFEPSGTLHRPSVDLAMQSAAECLGSRSAGVLLTGMGSDGAWGMWAIKSRGGRTIAQSEESCVVYGMPGAAVELNAVSELVPLEQMAERITALARTAREADRR